MRRIDVLLFLGLFGCATDGATADNDAGPDPVDASVPYDSSVNPWDGTTTRDSGPDATPADDATFPDTTPDLDANAFDAPDGACLAAGQPCSTLNNDCPFFFACHAAFDGGLDGSANDGICLYVFDFPRKCNDGTSHCQAGEACLKMSQMCLTAAENACICGDASAVKAACGPP